jgi:hypothetical protein
VVSRLTSPPEATLSRHVFGRASTAFTNFATEPAVVGEFCFRACANRSWSTVRSALPTVVGPSFSYELGLVALVVRRALAKALRKG